MIGDCFDLRLIFISKGYCNYRCTFCHEEGVSNARTTSRFFDFDSQELRKLVDWLRPLGLDGVSFSGGEPLLRIKKVVEVANALGDFPLTLLTNGARLSHIRPYIEKLGTRTLRVNINLPSFENSLFWRLTGQSRYDPLIVLGSVPYLTQAGIEVNVCCVLCPGENDSPEALVNYVSRAERYEIANIRFIVQGNDPEKHEAILNALAVGGVIEERRGGRVRRYKYRKHCNVEIVSCEIPKHNGHDFKVNSKDIYLSETGSVKFGLFGREHFFSGWRDLHLKVTSYIEMHA